MALSLPQVDLSALQSAEPYAEEPNASADLSHDYGTPNLLFLTYIPVVPDSVKETLAEWITDIKAWHAYELAQTEKQVNARIREKKLPGDDSVASRVKRTVYRAKVVEVLRDGNEQWLATFSLPTGTTVADSIRLTIAKDPRGTNHVEVKEGQVDSVIAKELLANYSKLPAQFSVFLPSLLGIIAGNPRIEHKFYVSQCSLLYDSEPKTIHLNFQVSSFSVKQQDLGDGRVAIDVSYYDREFNFSLATWRHFKSEVEDVIKAGGKMRDAMSMTFLEV